MSQWRIKTFTSGHTGLNSAVREANEFLKKHPNIEVKNMSIYSDGYRLYLVLLYKEKD